MSKAIVKIDIPTDYADEYKQWMIDGRLCYLEDGAWTHLKDIECELKPTDKAIPIEFIKEEMESSRYIWSNSSVKTELYWRGVYQGLAVLIRNWEKENDSDDKYNGL